MKERADFSIFGSRYLLLGEGMEAWKKELERNLGTRLGFEEDLKDEFEIEFFLLMVDVVSTKLLEESFARPKVRGSIVGREFVFCHRETYDSHLYKDYLSETLTDGPVKFWRWFRMRRDLFKYIVDSAVKFDPWFLQRPDTLSHMGLSTL